MKKNHSLLLNKLKNTESAQLWYTDTHMHWRAFELTRVMCKETVEKTHPGNLIFRLLGRTIITILYWTSDIPSSLLIILATFVLAFVALLIVLNTRICETDHWSFWSLESMKLIADCKFIKIFKKWSYNESRSRRAVLIHNLLTNSSVDTNNDSSSHNMLKLLGRMETNFAFKH